MPTEPPKPKTQNPPAPKPIHQNFYIDQPHLFLYPVPMVRRIPLFLLLVILSASTLHSQQQDQTPIVEGYVTRVTSLSDFDVTGLHVIPRKKTTYLSQNDDPHWAHVVTDPPYFGQAVSVSGDIKKKTHEILAKDV